MDNEEKYDKMKICIFLLYKDDFLKELRRRTKNKKQNKERNRIIPESFFVRLCVNVLCVLSHPINVNEKRSET